MALRTRQASRAGYTGSWFAAASALPLDGGLFRPRRLATLVAASLRRPGQALALLVVLSRTPSERVVLSTSVTGQALIEYFGERSFGVFPQNRLCRGVLVLPDHHSDYLRGRRRQALRTNLRRAESAGIECEAITDPQAAFAEVERIVDQRQVPLTPEELPVLASWRAVVEQPEMTLFMARDRLGCPLAIIGAVIDDDVCVIRLALASSHDARWALHDHLVRTLIARGVSYVLGEGGGPFGALGFDSNIHHYQHLLGYELRHLRPHTPRRVRAPEQNALPADVSAGTGSRQPVPAGSHAGES